MNNDQREKIHLAVLDLKDAAHGEGWWAGHNRASLVMFGKRDHDNTAKSITKRQEALEHLISLIDELRSPVEETVDENG